MLAACLYGQQPPAGSFVPVKDLLQTAYQFFEHRQSNIFDRAFAREGSVASGSYMRGLEGWYGQTAKWLGSALP
jgi:hypothetical protein